MGSPRWSTRDTLDTDDADPDERYDPDESLVTVSDDRAQTEPPMEAAVDDPPAAATLVLIGLVVLANRDGPDREPFRPGVDTLHRSRPLKSRDDDQRLRRWHVACANDSGCRRHRDPTRPRSIPSPPNSPRSSRAWPKLSRRSTRSGPRPRCGPRAEGSDGALVDGPTRSRVTMAADGSGWATGSPDLPGNRTQRDDRHRSHRRTPARMPTCS